MASRRKEIAQAGGGDAAVIAGPGYRKPPDCKFDLKTAKARKEYGIVCRKLYELGRLSESKHIAASMYASIMDRIALADAEGRPARASWFKQMQDQLRVLDLDGLDEPIAAPVEAPTNKFARIGLPNRRQR